MVLFASIHGNFLNQTKKKPIIRSPKVMVMVVLLSLYMLPICVLAAKQREQQRKLRFGSSGEFKILQVADMHYADGKSTPCLDVLPKQFAGCSDLNTSAFVHRMILAEKPNLIVFTGTHFSTLSH